MRTAGRLSHPWVSPQCPKPWPASWCTVPSTGARTACLGVPGPMVPGEFEAPGGSPCSPGWGRVCLTGGDPANLPQQGARSPRGPGLGSGVCAQQTGSSEGDFSPMILCLPRRDPGSVSTQEAQEAGRGPGRNSLGWPRSQASCGQVCRVGGGGGDGAAKSSGRPLPTRNSALGTLEGLCPPAP